MTRRGVATLVVVPRKYVPTRGQNAALASAAIVLAGCGGTTHTTVTVTSTVHAPTSTVTVTATPAPPPGPKTTIPSSGTYLVNVDIAPGIYRTNGGYGCYWARLRSLDTDDVIDNNVSDGPQVVEIKPTDMAFLTKACASWQRS